MFAPVLGQLLFALKIAPCPYLDPHLICGSLGAPESTSQMASHLDWLSHLCTARGRKYLYFTMGQPLFALKIASSYEGIWTPSNTWGTRLIFPKGITVDSAVFAGWTVMTDRPRYDAA